MPIRKKPDEVRINWLNAAQRAMRNVPRERFVPEEFVREAGEDGPLPIGWGQTISQPSLVASMTAELQSQRDFRVLEIGTGSGFQSAVLAQLVREVFTVERIPELAESAAQRLAALGYNNVWVRCSDGFDGWPEHAPYDAIIVTAAIEEIPPALMAQLKEGGRMVIPIGPAGGVQELMLAKKVNGETHLSQLCSVRFVPFIHEGNGRRDSPIP